MIELNCNDFYRAIKMLAGTTNEYRLHFDDFDVHAVAVDKSNVIMQYVKFDEHSLNRFYMYGEEPKEVGIDVTLLLLFSKAHKSDGFMTLSFDGSSGKIETSTGAVFEFKTIPVNEIRKDPNIPHFNEDYSQFTISVKELKQAFKSIGCSKKDRVVFKFTGEGKLCIENRDANMQVVIPGADNKNYCMFSYDVINTIVKSCETKDNLRFTIRTDKPAEVVNVSANFENLFLCAPRIEAD